MMNMLKEMMGGKALTGDEATMDDRTTMATKFISNNMVNLVSDSGTFQVMLKILKHEISEWRAVAALKAAGLFIKNGKDVRIEDRTTLKGYVQELVRLGLVIADANGYTNDIQSALGSVVVYANQQQYAGVWNTCIEYIFMQNNNELDNHCFMTNLLDIITTEDKTFQGSLAGESITFPIKCFDNIVSYVDWDAPFEGEPTRDNISHELKYCITAFKILISRSSKERNHAVMYIHRIMTTSLDKAWSPTFTEILVSAIVSTKNVDITDPAIVSIIKTANTRITQ